MRTLVQCVYTSHEMFPQGMGWNAVAFLRQYPEALRQVVLYCICGAAGQARTLHRPLALVQS